MKLLLDGYVNLVIRSLIDAIDIALSDTHAVFPFIEIVCFINAIKSNDLILHDNEDDL